MEARQSHDNFMDRGGRDGLFSYVEQQINRLYGNVHTVPSLCSRMRILVAELPAAPANSRVVSCNLEMGRLKDGIFDLATKRFGTSVAVDQVKCGRSMSMADPRPCRNVY